MITEVVVDQWLHRAGFKDLEDPNATTSMVPLQYKENSVALQNKTREGVEEKAHQPMTHVQPKFRPSETHGGRKDLTPEIRALSTTYVLLHAFSHTCNTHLSFTHVQWYQHWYYLH